MKGSKKREQRASGRWEMSGTGLGPCQSRFICRSNMLFLCKNFNFVSAQYWPNNWWFFYNRERSLNIFLLFSLSAFPIHTQAILCASTIHGKSIKYFADVFYRDPIANCKQNRLLFGQYWGKTEINFCIFVNKIVYYLANAERKLKYISYGIIAWRRKKILIVTVRDHYLTFSIFWQPLFFIVHNLKFWKTSSRVHNRKFWKTSFPSLRNYFKNQSFKGIVSRDFCFWFFSWISFPPAPE